MPGLSDVEKEIRKLRKRLRQIENLERQEFEGRELTDAEEDKIVRKDVTRNQLQEYLVLFAQEIEDSVELKENVRVSRSAPAMARPCTSQQGQYLDEDEEEEEEVVPQTLTTYSTGGRSAESEWTTVGEKKPQQTRAAEPPTKPKNEPSKKNPEKRAAAQSTVVKQEVEPPQKLRKETPRGAQVSEAERRREAGRRSWAGRAFTMLTLEGHSDLVSAVHLDRDYLLSGSRDTTLKVWNVKNGFEEKSLGGHTDAVTALLLLSQYATQKFVETYELGQNERLIVSGSQDCSLKIWALNEGKLCRSIYTYNPVTALAYIDTPGLIVAGSGGGKVELWEPDSGRGLQSLIAHQDAVTALSSDGSMVYSSSVDGIIKVYQLREMALHIVHESDDVTCPSGSPLLLRHIRSMTASRDLVYYGDDGNNVKVLNWKKGEVHKLKNHHTGDFGSTDAMSCHDDTLLTSGYDLDNGVGYVNVWSLPTEDYMTTLRDESLPRIMCLSCASPASGQLMIATGGFSLQLWLLNTQKREGDVTVRAEYVPEFSAAPDDSDLDSDASLSESEGEQTTSFFWRSASRRPKGHDPDLEEKGWFSWCEIL